MHLMTKSAHLILRIRASNWTSRVLIELFPFKAVIFFYENPLNIINKCKRTNKENKRSKLQISKIKSSLAIHNLEYSPKES